MKQSPPEVQPKDAIATDTETASNDFGQENKGLDSITEQEGSNYIKEEVEPSFQMEQSQPEESISPDTEPTLENPALEINTEQEGTHAIDEMVEYLTLSVLGPPENQEGSPSHNEEAEEMEESKDHSQEIPIWAIVLPNLSSRIFSHWSHAALLFLAILLGTHMPYKTLITKIGATQRSMDDAVIATIVDTSQKNEALEMHSRAPMLLASIPSN